MRFATAVLPKRLQKCFRMIHLWPVVELICQSPSSQWREKRRPECLLNCVVMTSSHGWGAWLKVTRPRLDTVLLAKQKQAKHVFTKSSQRSQFSSVQFSRSAKPDSLRPRGMQHTRPPCPSLTPGVYLNSYPLSRWYHPTISSCHPLLLPPFQMSQFFASGGQRIGVSASASVLPMDIQDWSPLGWTGWISLQSKGLSRVFSNITAQQHQFFSAQLSL